MPRMLGIDYGKAYIGLALSDETCLIASPYGVLANNKFSLVCAELAKIAEEFEISSAVIGLPISLDGSLGAMGQAVKQFARNLEKELAWKIHLVDERMSTNAVNRAMLEADLSRQKRKERKDSAAAAYILQGWLDMQNPISVY